MMIAYPGTRPCEKWCPTCKQWLHHSRFRSRTRPPHLSVWFDVECKACQQKARNEDKNQDRARAIIKNRAVVRAYKLHISPTELLVEQGWWNLVAPFRALLNDPDARCPNCGHPFLNERDIQIDHIEPPRRVGDLAREHTRNLRFLCASCNQTKRNQAHEKWLDEQESARISNKRDRASDPDGSSGAPILPFE